MEPYRRTPSQTEITYKIRQNGIQVTQEHRNIVQADTPVRYRLPRPLYRDNGLERVEFLPLCGAAEGKIYVLDNGKSLMLALSQDLSQNRPAEAREHVRRFHELFFTLSPEKSAIEHNVKRALLLADKSVYHYYSDFAEKGYYNRIIAGNINQVLKVDSVVCDFDSYPYRAVTYATQKIIRQSNVTERSLVTTCRLLNSSRSDDNPNGFTIEGFTIIENKDLQTIKR